MKKISKIILIGAVTMFAELIVNILFPPEKRRKTNKKVL
jgi:hypothetical protein